MVAVNRYRLRHQSAKQGARGSAARADRSCWRKTDQLAGRHSARQHARCVRQRRRSPRSSLKRRCSAKARSRSRWRGRSPLPLSALLRSSPRSRAEGRRRGARRSPEAPHRELARPRRCCRRVAYADRLARQYSSCRACSSCSGSRPDVGADATSALAGGDLRSSGARGALLPRASTVRCSPITCSISDSVTVDDVDH